jgi:phenylpropionate dioxygenase-like ring-hydroxylating dioxygenase large terminal subunit
MLNTQQPVLRRFWYAVMPLSQLKDGPQPFTLLGEPIVLFLDANGEPAALEDRCCHRTAKLSKGWCRNGNIVCGYHGWEYDRDGKLVMIPQFPFEQPIPDAQARSFRAQTRYGYVWVALDEPLGGIPDVPEDRDPGYRRIHQFYDKWNTSALRLMENSFDNAHFAFVHKGTFGDINQPKPEKYEIVETDYGFDAETIITIRKIRPTRPEFPERRIRQRNDISATNGSCRSAGGLTWNIRPESGTSSSTVRHRCPTARFRSFKFCFATTPKRTAPPRS